MKRCSICGKLTTRENIFIKTATFKRWSEPNKIVRQRVIAHICASCIVSDTDFSTPGYESTRNASEAKIRADALRSETLAKISEAGF